MTSPLTDHVRELLRQSLLAWGLRGSVDDAGDGAILVSAVFSDGIDAIGGGWEKARLSRHAQVEADSGAPASLCPPCDVRVQSMENRIRVEPAPPRLPFRWMVTTGERRRGAVSVVAVLRQVRTALDPGYATMPARVTAFPLLPPSP